ncbi:hypothetical protein [Halalkalibacter sp. APA_J-10(15)]|uniref:hypothetical protein n=1 Tax=Halalkalibacter sp. APA_J-10(15) TaxID=2933805 RepID=UPI001FF1746C|nr:hypothetical protein [Halalkalibacter sp. APA_J-10(15)]MCK0471708.1 hypothetical protein [Halalkalibacter sp. APA_J-10(15)]
MDYSNVIEEDVFVSWVFSSIRRTVPPSVRPLLCQTDSHSVNRKKYTVYAYDVERHSANTPKEEKSEAQKVE